MRSLSILGGLILQAVASLGQQAYQDTPSPDVSAEPQLFHYHGCAKVDLSGFGDAITFSDGMLTHDACQAACEGHSIAALFSNACRCGDDSDAFSSLDDSACDYPCMGDPIFGMCGSQCPTKGPSISTIYITSDVLKTEFKDQTPGLPVSVPVEVGPTSSDPPLVPQVTSDPPNLPSDSPAEALSVVWESTTAPDTTTQSTTERSTSGKYHETTLLPTANTTASRISSSASESETPNVERDNDDPPTPSQILQADAGGLMDQSISYMGAVALVVAAAV